MARAAAQLPTIFGVTCSWFRTVFVIPKTGRLGEAAACASRVSPSGCFPFAPPSLLLTQSASTSEGCIRRRHGREPFGYLGSAKHSSHRRHLGCNSWLGWTPSHTRETSNQGLRDAR